MRLRSVLPAGALRRSRSMRFLPAVFLSIAASAISTEAQAQGDSCSEFHRSIVAMEASSPRPPGWYKLDKYLRTLYAERCHTRHIRPTEKEWWYRRRGTRTNVPASGERPGDGAYVTTEDIAESCPKTDTAGMCALLRGLEKRCRSSSSRICDMLLGEEREWVPDGDTAYGDWLPALTATIDGKTYDLGLTSVCTNILVELEDGTLDAAKASGSLQRLRRFCPDFVAAVERRLGLGAERDAARFWDGLSQLLRSNFAPPGASPSAAPASVANDPGYRRMCAQAEEHMNTCAQREAQYRTTELPPKPPAPGSENSPYPRATPYPFEPDPRNPKSGRLGSNVDEQADHFRECHRLYGTVVDMCRNTQLAAAPLPRPSAAAPSVPKAAPRPAPGQSRPPAVQAPRTPAPTPPNTVMSGMTPRCQQLVSNYVAAARAKNGPAALAGYQALKAAGGCGVLHKVDRPQPRVRAPAPSDSRFISRGATPNTDQVVGACDASPAECAARVRQLQAGTSDAAKAALYAHAFSVGWQLGTMIGSGVLMAVPPSTPAPRMNTVGPGGVRNTYGQGAPLRPAPRTRQSDITGTK